MRSGRIEAGRFDRISGFGCVGNIDVGKETGVHLRARRWPRVFAASGAALSLLLVGVSLLGPKATAGRTDAELASALRPAESNVVARWTVMPYMGRSPSPSIFGVNTLTYDSSQAHFERDLPTAARLGARWVHFTNGSVHFSRSGQINWGVLDYEVRQARRLHLGVLLSLGGSPSSCSLAPRPSDFTGCPPTTRRALHAYRVFLRAELLRYRNAVQYWESWLEPDNAPYWRPRPRPQQYASLLLTQYEVFQQINHTYHTHLKLLFGGPSRFSTRPQDGWAVLPFVHAVLADLHGARTFDGIGLHAYRFPSQNTGPPTLNWGPTAIEYDYVGGIPYPAGTRGPYPAQGCAPVYSGYCQMSWSQELSAFEQEFANDGYPNMPLWLTEFGWPGNATARDALFPSFNTQAEYLRAAYTDILQLPFVQAAFWFNLRDYQPSYVSADPAFFYHYGLLQYGFTHKPAANVFTYFARHYPSK